MDRRSDHTDRECRGDTNVASNVSDSVGGGLVRSMQDYWVLIEICV